MKNVIDQDKLLQAIENSMHSLDNPGFCIECGAERDGCEPDAENYECYDCGENAVYGAEMRLIMGYAG